MKCKLDEAHLEYFTQQTATAKANQDKLEKEKDKIILEIEVLKMKKEILYKEVANLKMENTTRELRKRKLDYQVFNMEKFLTV